MRIGVVLDLDVVDVPRVPALAGEVERAGLELVWLCTGADSPHGALAAAASCASVADGLLVGAQVAVTDTHPLYVAEERNVADQLLGGRLVLALDASGGDPPVREWVSVLVRASGSAPFAHAGAAYTIPAGIAQNTINPEQQVRVTPTPFSLDPPLWVSGAPGVAAEFGASPLVGRDDSTDVASAAWRAVENRLGTSVVRLRRPGVRRWDPDSEDSTALAARLTDERGAWGLDTALVEPAMVPGSEAWRLAVADLAGVVRPRVQQHRLPAGLEEFWDRQRNAQHAPTERL